MKEFIDKLIERLEDERKSGLALHDFGVVGSYVNAISIVNELAEEYKGGWISVNDRLPEENGKYIV